MRMNGWGDNQTKYYLVRLPRALSHEASPNEVTQIGNPIVWWSGAVSLIVFVFAVLWYMMRFQRKITTDFAPGQSLLSCCHACSLLTSHRRVGAVLVCR